MLPLAWPSIIGGTTLDWARALSEFGATIRCAGKVLFVVRAALRGSAPDQ
jgi:ABC-type sulfate transport system permease component